MDLLDDLIFEDDEEQGPSEEEIKDAQQWDSLVSSFDPHKIEAPKPESNPLESFLARFSGNADGKKARRKSFLSMFSRQQKTILGVLIFLVVVVYAVMGTVVLRSTRQQATPVDNQIGLVADQSATETPEPFTPTPEATATLEPTATLPPSEHIPTSFDLQLNRDPSNAALHVERGYEYIEKGAFLAAYQDFTQAVELGDTSLRAQLGLGQANYHLMHWGAAEANFQNALDIDDTSIEAYTGLAQIYFYEGDYKRAANAYDAVAERNREDPDAEAWLAICAGHLGDADEAAGAVTRAISRTQESAIVYIAQSWAKRIQENPDLDGAHGDLLYANGLEPNNFHTLNELTLFYLEYRPERIGEAERYANWAINWAPDTAAEAVGHQTLGRVYLAQNRPDAALKEFQAAAALATSEDGKILIAGLEDDLAKVSP